MHRQILRADFLPEPSQILNWTGFLRTAKSLLFGNQSVSPDVRKSRFVFAPWVFDAAHRKRESGLHISWTRCSNDVMCCDPVSTRQAGWNAVETLHLALCNGQAMKNVFYHFEITVCMFSVIVMIDERADSAKKIQVYSVFTRSHKLFDSLDLNDPSNQSNIYREPVCLTRHSSLVFACDGYAVIHFYAFHGGRRKVLTNNVDDWNISHLQTPDSSNDPPETYTVALKPTPVPGDSGLYACTSNPEPAFAVKFCQKKRRDKRRLRRKVPHSENSKTLNAKATAPADSNGQNAYPPPSVASYKIPSLLSRSLYSPQKSSYRPVQRRVYRKKSVLAEQASGRKQGQENDFRFDQGYISAADRWSKDDEILLRRDHIHHPLADKVRPTGKWLLPVQEPKLKVTNPGVFCPFIFVL